MDIPAILEALTPNDRGFPREALEAAVAQREAITPYLIEVLDTTRERVGSLPDNYMLHTWAMWLLAQFREARAYPLVVALVGLPPETVNVLFGEEITEDLNRVLASVCAHDTSLIERLIESPEVDEFVRSSCMRALVTLVAAGRRSRESVLEYFRQLFHTGEAERGSYFWSGLVSASAALYPDLVMDEIRECYAHGLAEHTYFTLVEVEEVLACGKDAALTALARDCRFRLIDDVIGEAERWNWTIGHDDPEVELTSLFGAEESAEGREPILVYEMPSWEERRQPDVVGPKPGRNDPCPCGSGLKYKKCCLKGGGAG